MDIGKAGFQIGPNENQTRKVTEHVWADSKTSTREPEQKTVLDEVREKGFTAYAKELNDQKLEDKRKELLGLMGLTEEALADMSPEQQALINKIVDGDVRQYATAEAQLTGNKKELLNIHTVQNTLSSTPMPTPTTTSIDKGGVGIGPLLALQEIEQMAENEGGNTEKIADQEG